MEQKTALYDTHLRLGGQMITHQGYLLPAEYLSGVYEEHFATRKAAGIFDVSHMSEFVLSGPDALKNLQYLLTANFASLEIGRAKYSLLCAEDGSTLDDLLVFRLGEDRYFLVVGATQAAADFLHIKEHLTGDATLEDLSDSFSQIAVQGPLSEHLIRHFFSEIPETRNTFLNVPLYGEEILLSRTGYTGEDGFEVFLPHACAPRFFEELLAAGEGLGVLPCGLAARNSLRLEAGLVSYGAELSRNIDPITARLEYAVCFEKGDFIGREALLLPKSHTRVGLRVITGGLICQNCKLTFEGAPAGFVTTGFYCPYLKGAYAMAILQKEYADCGTLLRANNGQDEVLLEVVALPFYERED